MAQQPEGKRIEGVIERGIRCNVPDARSCDIYVKFAVLKVFVQTLRVQDSLR